MKPLQEKDEPFWKSSSNIEKKIHFCEPVFSLIHQLNENFSYLAHFGQKNKHHLPYFFKTKFNYYRFTTPYLKSETKSNKKKNKFIPNLDPAKKSGY